MRGFYLDVDYPKSQMNLADFVLLIEEKISVLKALHEKQFGLFTEWGKIKLILGRQLTPSEIGETLLFWLFETDPEKNLDEYLQLSVDELSWILYGSSIQLKDAKLQNTEL